MSDGIAGPVIGILAHDKFEILITHFRKDNKEEYGKSEKIAISKIDNPGNPEYKDSTQADLERVLKGRFVSCNVQYRDPKTDVLVCNVFVQNPPEEF